MAAASNGVFRSRKVVLAWRSLVFLLVIGSSLGCFTNTKPDEQRSSSTGRIERAYWFTFQNNTLFTAYAHILGRKWGGTKTDLVHDIVVYNPTSTEKVYVLEANMPGYAHKTRRRIRVPAKARRRVKGMTPVFELTKMYQLSTPVRAEAEVRLMYEGRELDVASQNLIIEPVNRVRWDMQLANGQRMDVRPMVVTLITPTDRHGLINRIITDAAHLMPGKKMVGYSGANTKEVILQAQAIYYAIKKRGLVYTNVPGTFFDRTQQVRLPSQSIATGSANCIDGVLLFASVFEALGMEPVLVFVRGHVLVGVRMSPRSSKIIYIETTVMSRATFKQAVGTGFGVVNRARKQRDPKFRQVDVKTMRARGLVPVSL